jgi:hypothetical protein
MTVLYDAPQPIATAPHEEDRPILVYCANYHSWHSAVWFRGKWLAYVDTSTVLEPTHWLEAPPDPQERTLENDRDKGR